MREKAWSPASLVGFPQGLQLCFGVFKKSVKRVNRGRETEAGRGGGEKKGEREGKREDEKTEGGRGDRKAGILAG